MGEKYGNGQSRLLTVMQQIEKLKLWHATQRNTQMMDESIGCSDPDKLISISTQQPNVILECNLGSINEDCSNQIIETAPLQNQNADAGIPMNVLKRPYLKKGSGLLKYKMASRKPSRVKKSHTLKNVESGKCVAAAENVPLGKTDSNGDSDHAAQSQTWTGNKNNLHLGKKDRLEPFELLEERACDSSFISTSSMIAKLMEDSIKSTPNKQKNPNTAVAAADDSGGVDVEPNCGKCGVKLVESLVKEPLIENNGGNEWESTCSCCGHSMQMSTSFAMVTEMSTTVTTPCRKKLFSGMGERFEFQEESGDKDVIFSQDALHALFQKRLMDLELEIDAFRCENAYMNQIRREYEREYENFKREKDKILTTIQEESQHSNIVKDGEKLRREISSLQRALSESKNRASKQHREEISSLKYEISKLKEELNKKESRWGAAQARIRTQVKFLEEQNAMLKEELSTLRKSCSKKVRFVGNSKKKSIVEKDKIDAVQSANDVTPIVLEEKSLNPTDGEQLYAVEKDADSTSEANLQDYGEIRYENGNVKKVSPDGEKIEIYYYNGDIKEIFQRTKQTRYYYAEDKTWHTMYETGLQLIEFPDGQVEKYFSDGSVEITYSNGNVCKVNPNEDKWIYKDGSIVINNKREVKKTTIFSNGQKEIHTPEYKKREYPDGTVKIVYTNGMQESRYNNGRIRLKDKYGNLISDNSPLLSD